MKRKGKRHSADMGTCSRWNSRYNEPAMVLGPVTHVFDYLMFCDFVLFHGFIFLFLVPLVIL